MKSQLATFGAGCFWGVEELYHHAKGVLSTAVGYMGGHTKNPTYEDVCTDKTGHVETVQIEYDSSQTTYEDLLKIFWENHDPTTPNRQGPDIGTQYRSVIFYHSPEQKELAEQSKRVLGQSGKYKDPIISEIVSASPFYRAEEYHQEYLHKRGLNTCRS